MIRSAAAVVVTDVDVVVVPTVLTMLDVLDPSTGLAATPLYSQAVITAVVVPPGVIVGVVSFPAEIFQNR
jgi:hypothetical protein